MRAAPGGWTSGRCRHAVITLSGTCTCYEGLRFLPSSQPAGSTQGGTPPMSGTAGPDSKPSGAIAGRGARVRIGTRPAPVWPRAGLAPAQTYGTRNLWASAAQLYASLDNESIRHLIALTV